MKNNSSIINEFSNKINNYIVKFLIPKIISSCFDYDKGIFHEAMDHSWKVNDLGYNRLLVQCRQIFSLTSSIKLGASSKEIEPIIERTFNFICGNYWNNESDGWKFSLGKSIKADSECRDLYAHAFVILACSSVYNLSKNPKALIYAEKTIDFIKQYFPTNNGGFYTRLDSSFKPIDIPREQNPHMHLLEACLSMYEASENKKYLQTAKEIIELFKTYFFHEDTSTLTEFFDTNWKPDSKKGNQIEAGHHFEWVWLIDWYIRASEDKDSELMNAASSLEKWAIEFGIDKQYGGIYDQVSREGLVLKDTKRIWPLTETLKALALSKNIEIFQSISNTLLDYYIKDNGVWIESHDREFNANNITLPGTTSYHLVMMAREINALLSR